MQGPVLDLPLIAIGSTRGDPTNVDVPAATATGIPVLRAPGRNADAVAEIDGRAAVRGQPRHVLPADRDVRAGDVCKDGTIPYQRFRAWQMAGRTAGLVGPRRRRAAPCSGASRASACRSSPTTRTPTTPRTRSTTCSPSADVVSMHAAVTPETAGMIGAAQFARMKDGAIFLNTARAQLHDTDALVDALCSRARSPAPASTTSSASTSPSTIR